jgi:tetratricopeptide (TPR) repeat protein
MNKHREEKEVLRLFQQAKKKRTEGEYLKALRFIEIVLEIQPDNVSFLLFKSTLLESDILHHANDEILQIYNRILELEPKNAEAWFLK